MSLAAKLLTILVIFAAGCAAGIRWHSGQDARAEVLRLEAQAETVRLARASETRRSTQVIEAQNASVKRIQTLALAAAGARTERDGLRDDIAAIRRGLPGATPDASRSAADTASELLGQCAAAYQDLAGAADGHASDALTLQQAWPR